MTQLTAIRVARFAKDADGSIPYGRELALPKQDRKGLLLISQPDDPFARLLGCPNCGEFGCPSNHTLTENADGTVSLHASVLTRCCGAHFYVNHNKIEWC